MVCACGSRQTFGREFAPNDEEKSFLDYATVGRPPNSTKFRQNYEAEGPRSQPFSSLMQPWLCNNSKFCRFQKSHSGTLQSFTPTIGCVLNSAELLPSLFTVLS